MISDYYQTYIKRVIAKVPDGGGSYSETTIETEFRGYLALLSTTEQVSSNQLGLKATARMFTEEIISEQDRILDGATVYEVVGVYNFHHRFYDLKRV